MSEAGNAFLISAVTVGLAGAVGYGIYRLALPKGQAVTPIQIGRKWFAWMAMIATFTALPRFVQTQSLPIWYESEHGSVFPTRYESEG